MRQQVAKLRDEVLATHPNPTQCTLLDLMDANARRGIQAAAASDRAMAKEGALDDAQRMVSSLEARCAESEERGPCGDQH